MDGSLAVSIGVFGLIFGSFATVLVARLPVRTSIVRPGSACPACGAAIRWWDNIPIVSYLLLAGKCRRCRAAISIRYPVIELLTAILFVAMYSRFGLDATLFARHLPYAVLVVAITFIDLEHRIIPDRLSIPGLVVGLATSWMTSEPGWIASILGAAIGFSLFYAFAWAYERSAGRAGLGGGDVKLLAMIGAFVGPLGVFWTVLISSVVGTVAGVAWAISQRRREVMGVAIPYGPFLVIGSLCYYLLDGMVPWFRFMTPT